MKQMNGKKKKKKKHIHIIDGVYPSKLKKNDLQMLFGIAVQKVVEKKKKKRRRRNAFFPVYFSFF